MVINTIDLHQDEGVIDILYVHDSITVKSLLESPRIIPNDLSYKSVESTAIGNPDLRHQRSRKSR